MKNKKIKKNYNTDAEDGIPPGEPCMSMLSCSFNREGHPATKL